MVTTPNLQSWQSVTPLVTLIVQHARNQTLFLEFRHMAGEGVWIVSSEKEMGGRNGSSSGTLADPCARSVVNEVDGSLQAMIVRRWLGVMPGPAVAIRADQAIDMHTVHIGFGKCKYPFGRGAARTLDRTGCR